MDPLTGIWRLIESRAWDEHGKELPTPYGTHPIGTITFSNGRMLAALCNGDTDVSPARPREFSSYGGKYTFDGATLVTEVDVASDPVRIGGQQVRNAVITGDRMVLRPPTRAYGGIQQRRELVWQKIWKPVANGTPGS